MIDSIWVFNGKRNGFAGGVFTDVELAKQWIEKHKLTGVLTLYPVNVGVYDWAIENGLFKVKKEHDKATEFIGGFTTASQKHHHFEDGIMEC